MYKLCSWPEEVMETSMQMNHHNIVSLEACVNAETTLALTKV